VERGEDGGRVLRGDESLRDPQTNAAQPLPGFTRRSWNLGFLIPSGRRRRRRRGGLTIFRLRRRRWRGCLLRALLLEVAEHVFLGDPPTRTGTGQLADVDAFFFRQMTSRRRQQDFLFGVGSLRRFGRSGLGIGLLL